MLHTASSDSEFGPHRI